MLHPVKERVWHLIEMTELLEEVLSDLRRLRTAYERRGLLSLMPGSTSSATGHHPAGHHRAALHGATAPSPLARDLLLSDALLRNVIAASKASGPGLEQHGSDSTHGDAATPWHVAVFGGTQVGKSTVLNVLAGRELATVHHTAGYTRHAQGFTPPGLPPEAALAPFPRCFPGFVRVPRTALSQDRPLEYSLEELSQPAALPHAVFWDAPDCDAVNSSVFQQGFVEALTLADVVVYVTSREKYAVNAILEWVARLRSAGVPVLSVLNMTPRSQQPELKEDMERALARVSEAGQGMAMPEDSGAASFPGTKSPLPIIAFEYVSDGDVSLLYDAAYAPGSQLRDMVRQAGSSSVQQARSRKQQALAWMEQTMPTILEPALRDFDAWQQWNDRVAAALEQFTDDYRRYYLNDPHRYDAFNRVGLEILELLNPPVPGLQKTLAAVRTVVSLPARALLAGGKAVYRYAASGGRSFSEGPAVSHETATYRDAHDKLIDQLARYVEQRRRAHDGANENFWQALDQGWEDQVPRIEKEFESALELHRSRTDEWTRDAARAIYQELARDPVKLNVLRTSRIAADAAAIVVSIKTGGPGDVVHDLVVAPALMSLVEAATRHIAGSYVEQKKDELRQRLVQDTQRFAEEVYGRELGSLAAQSLDKIGLDSCHADDIRTLTERIGRLRLEMDQ